MTTSLQNPQVISTLQALYADAHANDPAGHQALKDFQPKNALDHYQARSKLYMPIDREFGGLLYGLARAVNAKTIVEFGLSFGISTIFLASAVRDQRDGVVVTTEFIPEKAERARQNLAKAGLENCVDIRVGDALQTLKAPLPGKVDLVLLDGEKSLYLGVLKLLEPHLRPGSLIASDNTDFSGMEDFLEYLRNPRNGYVSTAFFTPDRDMKRAHEISVRL